MQTLSHVSKPLSQFWPWIVRNKTARNLSLDILMFTLDMVVDLTNERLRHMRGVRPQPTIKDTTMTDHKSADTADWPDMNAETYNGLSADLEDDFHPSDQQRIRNLLAGGSSVDAVRKVGFKVRL